MNFSPDLTTGTAVFLSLLAAFLWGTWFISLKYLGDYPIDGFYMTLFTTSIVFVWAVAWIVDRSALFTDISRVWSTDPSRITLTLLCGILYVVGIRISLIVLQRIGLSLSQPIQASINILVGTLISGLVGGIPAGVSPLGIAVACLLLVGAVFVSMLAGRWHSSEQKDAPTSTSSLRYTQSDLFLSAGLLVISSLFLQAYTFGLSYGLRSTIHAEGLAILPFMAVLASGAFIGALLTSGMVLTLRHQWDQVFHAPFSIHKFGIISGLFHYGGNIIHTMATAVLSPVISWPLGVTMGLWTQFWGLVYGEFKGASRRAYAALFAGILLYLIGAYLITVQTR